MLFDIDMYEAGGGIRVNSTFADVILSRRMSSECIVRNDLGDYISQFCMASVSTLWRVDLVHSRSRQLQCCTLGALTDQHAPGLENRNRNLGFSSITEPKPTENVKSTTVTTLHHMHHRRDLQKSRQEVRFSQTPPRRSGFDCERGAFHSDDWIDQIFDYECNHRLAEVCLKPCPQKSATVAEFGDSRTFLRQSHDSRRFLRQSHFSATVWPGLNSTWLCHRPSTRRQHHGSSYESPLGTAPVPLCPKSAALSSVRRPLWFWHFYTQNGIKTFTSFYCCRLSVPSVSYVVTISKPRLDKGMGVI